MRNLLKNGAAWLGLQMQSHAGRTVRLVVGEYEIEGLTAVLANKQYDVFDDNANLIRILSHDWTLVAREISDSCGFEIEIVSGSYIEEMEDGEVIGRYEALPIGKQPCVEPAGASGILITVHTKKIKDDCE
jgi:hypothetical protein